MNYITQEEYAKASLQLPNPNKSSTDEIEISVSTTSEDGSTRDNVVRFVKVLFCDSPRIPEIEYKWLLDRRYNQMN